MFNKKLKKLNKIFYYQSFKSYCLQIIIKYLTILKQLLLIELVFTGNEIEVIQRCFLTNTDLNPERLTGLFIWKDDRYFKEWK
jgi:hypothetical protein